MCYDQEGLGSPLNASFASREEIKTRCETFNTQNVVALWEWEHEKGWQPFDAPLCNELESAWASGATVCHVSVGGEEYDINFVYMWQQNCLSHTTRPIHRTTWKEAPTWYWWNRDGCHRLGATVAFLLEAEYQKILAEGQHERHEVIWTVEGGNACTLNVATMQVTVEATGQSYPLTRTLIKPDPSLSVDAGTKATCDSIQQERRDLMDARSCNSRTTTRAPRGRRRAFKNQVSPDPDEPRADSSLHLSVQRSNVSVQMPQGASATIQICAPEGQQQQPLQRYHQTRSVRGSNIFLTVGSPSCPCDLKEGNFWRSCCTSRCTCWSCSVNAGCSCHRHGCCSYPGCFNSSPSKHPGTSGGDLIAPKCMQCNVAQQNMESASGGGPIRIQAATSASAENGLETQQFSPSPTRTGSGGSPQHQDARSQQQEDPQKETTKEEQQRLLQHLDVEPQQQEGPQRATTQEEQQRRLQQQTWNSQQSQLLLRQEEQLKRQTRIEVQEELQQQQQLVQKLQLQHDQLLENHRELRDQQQQLVQQHAEQQQLFLQQAEELQQLRSWALRRESLEKPGCNEEDQTSRPAKTPEPEVVNLDQAPLSGSGQPVKTVSSELHETYAAAEHFQSPVEDGRADDDEYTCI